MLAQNFLTADELGLTSEWHQGMITLLGMMERGEVKWSEPYKPIPNGFNMAHMWHEAEAGPECGTVGCIHGWVVHLTRGVVAQYRSCVTAQQTRALEHLCTPDGYHNGHFTVEQSAKALRAYLVTGTPDWGA